MQHSLIAVVVLALVAAGWMLWRSPRISRSFRSKERNQSTSVSVSPGQRIEFPSTGLLVPEEVLRASGPSSTAIWDALEAAAVPVAFEYYPASDLEIAKYRVVPVNASAQQAFVGILNALNPKAPTIFRAVLPEGAELVRAVGADGFRGFSRTGGTTTHALLKPVAVGGAAAAGWPVLAVAGTVMAIDMVAQREQRAHQRRVEASLGRQEQRYYVERIKDQRSADAQLSRAITQMLDGCNPRIELALKSADDEFFRSQQFLEKYSGVIERLADEGGMVDHRQLERALGGETKQPLHFMRELHLAQAANAIRRKALVLQHSVVALADPGNPYTALRKLMGAESQQLEQADAAVAALTEQLLAVELKGRWHDRAKSLADRQDRFRAQVAPLIVEGAAEVLYLSAASGAVFQLLPAGGDEPAEPAFGM